MRLLLILLLAGQARAAGDPLARELARLKTMGYAPEARATGSSGKARLDAVLYAKEADPSDQSLYVYETSPKGTRLIHMDPGSARVLSLDPVHAKGRLPDLAGDGSRVVAYSAKAAGGDHALTVLRWRPGRIESAVDPLPFGRLEDIDGDGRLEAVSRVRPLGRFFSMECETFRSMAQKAFRTTVHSWKGGRLVPASAEHAAYFERLIAQDERALAGRDPRADGDYGGFLGGALSLYFDHAELGRKREGWDKFKGLFPTEGAPAPAKKCLKKMEETLKDRLAIPEGW